MKAMPINGFRRGIGAQDAVLLSRFALLRPVWTHRSLCGDQFAPRHIEVGQGEQGEELGGVLGQASISYLAIAPQVLDDPKGMFDPGPYAIALAVERPVRAGKAPAAFCFAVHPPGNAFGLGLLPSLVVRIGLVAIDGLLLSMQTSLHHLGVMHRGGGGRHTVHPPLGIAAHVGLHAEVKGVALLRAGHLGVPFPILVLRRRRRMDDRGVHDRAFADHHPPIGKVALRIAKQCFGQAVRLQKVSELADRRLVRHAVQIHAGEAAHRFYVVEAVFHRRVAKTVPLLHEIDPQHHRSPDGTTAVARFRIMLQNWREQDRPGQYRVHLAQKAFLARLFLLLIVGHVGKAPLFHGRLPRFSLFGETALQNSGLGTIA